MRKCICNLLFCLLWVMLGSSMTSCSSEGDVRLVSLKESLKKQYGVTLDKEITRIYVLNDLGCGSCVSSLANYVFGYVDDDHSLVIINSRGININLDAFEMKKKTNPNIVISHTVLNDKSNLFAFVGAIFLKEERVDTIVNVLEGDVIQSLQYIADYK